MFSIILLALVNANYNFVYVDVDCSGRISEGGDFRRSSLSTTIENNFLDVPPPRKIGQFLLPYVIAEGEAFPLK